MIRLSLLAFIWTCCFSFVAAQVDELQFRNLHSGELTILKNGQYLLFRLTKESGRPTRQFYGQYIKYENRKIYLLIRKKKILFKRRQIKDWIQAYDEDPKKEWVIFPPAILYDMELANPPGIHTGYDVVELVGNLWAGAGSVLMLGWLPVPGGLGTPNTFRVGLFGVGVGMILAEVGKGKKIRFGLNSKNPRYKTHQIYY